MPTNNMTETPKDTAQLCATRRLMKDYAEVMRNPLTNVVAEPLEDDLFRWHCNVRQPEGDGVFDGVTFHIELQFDQLYPTSMPRISLFTPVPHPNVRRTGGAGGSGWRLDLWDCIPSWKGWSSAYTVQSILVQLQAFLLADDLHYDTTKVTLDQSLHMAAGFSCDHCGHQNDKPRHVTCGLTLPTQLRRGDCQMTTQ